PASSTGWPRTGPATAAARPRRRGDAPSRAAGAGRPRTARPGSGTRAGTGSASGWLRPGDSCGLRNAVEDAQQGLAVDGVAQRAHAGLAEPPGPGRVHACRRAAGLQARDDLAGLARRFEAITLQQEPFALAQLEVETAIGLAVLLELRGLLASAVGRGRGVALRQ